MTEKETLADKEIIELVYNKVYNTMFELMKQEGYKPLVIAAVMMAQSMRLYRTCLEDSDFNSLVEEVVKTLMLFMQSLNNFSDPTSNLLILLIFSTSEKLFCFRID